MISPAPYGVHHVEERIVGKHTPMSNTDNVIMGLNASSSLSESCEVTVISVTACFVYEIFFD